MSGGSNGVNMSGGALTNMAGGVITGGSEDGVLDAATVVNSGRIMGGSGFAGNDAVQASNGVTNLGTGLIEGYSGIALFQAGGVVNGATIEATGSSGYGISLGSGGTVVDSGVISGATAAVFGGTGSNVLALEAGYSLSGAVIGGTLAGASNTLELSGALGAVTVGYNGLGLTNFQDVLFGPSGGATLAVSNTGGTLPVTVSGLTLTGDAVDFSAIGTNGSIAGQSAAAVTVSGSLGSVTLPLGDAGHFRTQSDGRTGTDLVVACFRGGTRIATGRGPASVETLHPGDRVATASGRMARVVWLGSRRIDCRRHPRPGAVLPVRIRAHAFGPGVPHCDLFLSPDHAVFAGGALVPVRHLVNGRTIVQERVAEVTYVHLELAAHDLVVAEGLACESYLDTGNRAAFADGATLEETAGDRASVPSY